VQRRGARSSYRLIPLLVLAVYGVRAGPQSPTTLDRANAEYRSGNAAAAVVLFQEYLNHNPDRPDVRVFLGAALYSLSRFEEAIEQARRALAIDKRYAKAYTLLGRIHADHRNWDLARKAHAEALSLTPEDAEAWYFAGRALYQQNTFEEAVSAFKRALALGAEYSRTYENLALSQEALGRFVEAETAYRRAIQLGAVEYRPNLAYGALNPGEADVRFEYGRALLHAGEFAAAEVVLEGSADQNPPECRLVHLLTRIYARQGKKDLLERESRKLANCTAVSP
jgi:Flp pilus assembly protein TadD